MKLFNKFITTIRLTSRLRSSLIGSKAISAKARETICPAFLSQSVEAKKARHGIKVRYCLEATVRIHRYQNSPRSTTSFQNNHPAFYLVLEIRTNASVARPRIASNKRTPLKTGLGIYCIIIFI